jgi:phosphatidylglycerophosphate synthase
VLLIAVTVIIDLADGALARKKSLYSSYGAWLDLSLDNIFQLALLSSMVISVNIHHQTMLTIIFGVAVLFGQAMAHVLGGMFRYELGFDPYSGISEFLDVPTKSFFENFLKNIVVPSTFIYIVIFTARYTLVASLLVNKLDWFLFSFGIFINIRWIFMWLLFYFYMSDSSVAPGLVRFLKNQNK